MEDDCMRIRLGMNLRAGCCVGALLVALVPRLACAALGEPESSIAGDVQHLKGSIKSMDRSNYRVHEIQLPSGTVLREFAAVGGNVFAVTWSGPAIPDLRQALGRYFDVYVTAAQAKHGSHRHLQIEQSEFVMQSSGHMRAFSGRAYLPQALPPGTSADEIR
jgi:Protein of unknown function (DUF2844)